MGQNSGYFCRDDQQKGSIEIRLSSRGSRVTGSDFSTGCLLPPASIPEGIHDRLRRELYNICSYIIPSILTVCERCMHAHAPGNGIYILRRCINSIIILVNPSRLGFLVVFAVYKLGKQISSAGFLSFQVRLGFLYP